MTATIRDTLPLTTRIVAGRRLESHVEQAEARGGILVATDGESGSTDAVRFAVAMSREIGAPLQILTVLEPIPLEMDKDIARASSLDLLQLREDNLHLRVRNQLSEVIGDQPTGTNLQYGRVVPVIADAATAWCARLIVTGLGRHELASRAFGSETALRVAAAAAVPTLVVAAGRVVPPMTIVVAVDFTATSERAAKAAVDIVPVGAEVTLLHVNPFPYGGSADAQAWNAIYLAGVESLFDELAERLRSANDRITIRTALVEGRPAERVLDIAALLGADLVAVGRHAPPATHGERVGGTVATLIRGATCSVLVAP